MISNKSFTRASFLLTALFYTLFSFQAVFAEGITGDQLKQLDEEPNWVASQCSPTSNGDPLQSGKQVYIMGDSITELAKNSYTDTFQTEGWTADVEGLSSRHLASSPPTPSGLDQLDKDKSVIANVSAVVIGLGTNDSGNSAASIKANVQKAIQKIKNSNSSAPIYWINVMDTRSDKHTQNVNQAIQDGVGNEAKIIDWHATAKSDANLASFSDGVHPTKDKDIALLTKLVFSNVNKGFASSTQNQDSTCCAATGSDAAGTVLTGNGTGEKVYNFFIGKGLSNESAAAATGNLQLESANWSAIDGWGGGGGNYYGIAQWDRTVRYANLVKFAGGAANAAKLNYQLDFVWHELTTVSSYNPVLDILKSKASLRDKVIAWGRIYEGAITNGALQMQDQRIVYAQAWAKKGGGSGGDTGSTTPDSSSSATDCVAGGGSNGQAFIDGKYAWPVDLKKSEVSSGYPWPCKSTCHHDNTYAFDLSTKKAIGGNDADVVGRDEFAISDGVIESLHIYDGIAGCYSIELRSTSDGYWYWYGHMRRPSIKEGDKVKVGQKVGEVGERKCTGNGSYPHLHIDRGSPKGSPGGYVSHRDAGINDIMNNLYARLPD